MAHLLLRVSTYNVLSPRLCSAGWFPHCESLSSTDPKERFPRVVAQLKGEVESGAVICLQEVAREWVGPLTKYFNGSEYVYVHSSYGHPFNGYMGVGIAFPRNRYVLQECKIVRVSDTKQGGYRPPKQRVSEQEPSSLVNRVVQVPTKLVKSAAGFALSALRGAKSFMAGVFFRVGSSLHLFSVPPKFVPWKDIEWRKNTCVMVCLTPKLADGTVATGKDFCVGTYHMPCAFKTPAVIAAHSNLVLNALEQFAGTKPYILAGDFNLKPDSALYALITEGKIPDGDMSCDLEPAYPGDAWRMEDLSPMKSAYKSAFGSEPEFTNFAWNKMMPDEAFVGCLDYIFYRDARGLRVAGADKLVSLADLSPLKSLPSEQEPSDHLKLAAEFTFNT